VKPNLKLKQSHLPSSWDQNSKTPQGSFEWKGMGGCDHLTIQHYMVPQAEQDLQGRRSKAGMDYFRTVEVLMSSCRMDMPVI
jgi:hypothetical protein